MSSVFVTSLIVASSILTVIAAIPYITAVVKRTTKPRIVSWFIWTLLTGISAVASFSDHQYPGGILLTAGALSTFAVVILGWKYGDKRIERLDIVCFAGAMLGILLWYLFDNPAIAIVAAICVDIIGGIPTWVHIWKKPQEETGIFFFISFLGAFFTLLASHDLKVTAIAYPLYLVLVNFSMAVLIYVGQHKHSKRLPIRLLKRAWRVIKKYRWWLLGLIITAVIMVWGAWTFALVSTNSMHYDSARTAAKDVPERRVAIVFGAHVNGTDPSAYLQFRVEAAVALYKAGRVQKLLMTGDNSKVGYDEPTAMRDLALKLGVKDSDITLDYAGFSTYESCYRAKHIFGVNDAVLVSQNYHLPRAIMTCRALGINSIGYGARVIMPELVLQYTIREWFSTDKAVLQIATHAKPTFLGKPEAI